VHIRIFFPVVELVGDDLFAVAVREEVYRACRDDADEGGSEASEQRKFRFVSCNISEYVFLKEVVISTSVKRTVVNRNTTQPHDMRRLDKMMPQEPSGSSNKHDTISHHGTDMGMFLAEEIRLETRLDHIKGARDDGTAHPSKANNRLS
jgi:hypothetical protein